MQTGVGTLLITMMLAQAGAGNEAAPLVPEAVVDGDPVLAETPDAALLTLQPATIRLYNALRSGASDEEVENLVSAAAIELDMNCPRVKEYQVYRASTRARTLKIKCVERPVYAVTIGPSGEGFVSGGDGTISQMRLEDGPIKAVLGVRVEDYVASTKAAAPAEDSIVEPLPLHRGRNWLMGLVWTAGFVAALWLLGLFVRERRRLRRSLSRWRGLDTAVKDQLVEESEEIYPNLYRHPEGVFIARGRRGKRRLFSSLVFAYLYSSRGFKLFEIR